MGTSKLGNMLVEDGLLSETDRRTIKRTCGTGGSAFARGILAMGLLDEDELAAYIAEHTHWKVASKNLLDVLQNGAWGCIDRPLVEQLEVLPLKLVGDSLQVAMVDPLDQDTLSQLAFFTGYKILPTIATHSQVRKGLQRVMPDYTPTVSLLEEFLKNHSISAGKKIRLADESLYEDLPVPDSFSFGGASSAGAFDISFEDEESLPETNDVQRVSAKADTAGISFENDEDLELGTTNIDIDGTVNFSPAVAKPTAEDDNLFSIEDDSFELDRDDSESEAGFDTSLLDPDLGSNEAAAKPKLSIVSSDESEDLENLMDLSDFDPEKDDLDDSLLATDSFDIPMEKSTGAGVSADDDLLGLSVSDDDLMADLTEGAAVSSDPGVLDDDFNFDDLSADFGTASENETKGGSEASFDLTSEMATDLDGDLSDDLSGELSADLDNLTDDISETSEISFEMTDDMAADLANDMSADLDGIGDLDGVLAEDDNSPDESLAGLEDDVSSLNDQDLSSELTSELSDNLQSESPDDFAAFDSPDLDDADFETTPDESALTSDLTELTFEAAADNSDEISFDEPLGLVDDLNITAEATPVKAMPQVAIRDVSQDVSATINKMFFHVSMSTETKQAIGTIAKDLKASGFSTGMIMGGTASSVFRPECGWQDTPDSLAAATSESLKNKGITAALGRLTTTWTALDDAVRQGDLKVFASLQRENKRLFGIKFKDGDSGPETVIVTAMAAEITENEDLMTMAANLFRQVAQKNKGAA